MCTHLFVMVSANKKFIHLKKISGEDLLLHISSWNYCGSEFILKLILRLIWTWKNNK